MSKIKKRRRYSGDEKATILRRHLVDKVASLDLCDQYRLSPAMFYRWQKEFFKKGGSVFQNSSSSKTGSEKQIAALEAKLTQKNEVLAELMEEHLNLKINLGCSNRLLGLSFSS